MRGGVRCQFASALPMPAPDTVQASDPGVLVCYPDFLEMMSYAIFCVGAADDDSANRYFPSAGSLPATLSRSDVAIALSALATAFDGASIRTATTTTTVRFAESVGSGVLARFFRACLHGKHSLRPRLWLYVLRVAIQQHMELREVDPSEPLEDLFDLTRDIDGDDGDPDAASILATVRAAILSARAGVEAVH